MIDGALLLMKDRFEKDTQRIAALEQAARLALEALEAVELVGNDSIQYCPWCDMDEDLEEYADPRARHKPDCKRQAAIAALQAVLEDAQ